MNYDDNGSKLISYVTNTENLSISISCNFNLTYPSQDNAIVYSDSIIEFYVVKTIDGMYQAVGVNDNIKYSIKYNDYNELINILNGIKEIEK